MASAAESDPYAARDLRYEARAWLAANANSSPLATNRFQTHTAAAAFVESLYQMGAHSVYVLNVLDEPERIAEEGGPYADTLLVRLPDRSESRRRLFEVHERESEREGLDPEFDGGQPYLYFWWD